MVQKHTNCSKNNICATEYDHSTSCIANPTALQLSITLIYVTVPERKSTFSPLGARLSLFSAILSINRILAHNQRPFVLS